MEHILVVFTIFYYSGIYWSFERGKKRPSTTDASAKRWLTERLYYDKMKEKIEKVKYEAYHT